MAREAELLDALGWRPKPPVPSSLKFALLAWDFEKTTPEYEYEVELPEADYKPMYVEFVSAAYAAALDTIGDLQIPDGFGESPGIISNLIGILPGTSRGTEADELWAMAVAWEFDTWLERILRLNGGDVDAARLLAEDRCPVPPYVANMPDLKTELLNYPSYSDEPDTRILLRWMGVRGWNDDRVREIVQEHSIMLNDWGHASPFLERS